MQIGHCFVPHFTPARVVCQSFDLVGQMGRIAALKGRQDASMERASPLLQEAAVGDLVGESMLEGIDTLGAKTRLIEKLSSP
jgi:hypothetical protein